MKFSDALRGAADRAPVDEVRVSTDVITGRIKRERVLRAGANSLVGAGAVAVITFAAIGPIGGAGDQVRMANESAGMDGAGEVESGAADAPMEAADEGVGAGALDAYSQVNSPWVCGSDFDTADGLWTWGDTSGVTYTVDAPEADEEAVRLPNTLEAHRIVEMISFSDYVITWDGMVVGQMIHPETLEYGPDTGAFLPEGQVYERLEPGTDFHTLEQWTLLNPVNCWDGAALPAGDYEVHQGWTLAYVGEDTAPGDEDGEPGDGPEVTSEMPILLEPFRVAAGPVALTIDGEAVEDPFGDYLSGFDPIEPHPLPEPIDPLPVEPLPEGSLTPDLARELFDANATNGAWDMAAGSQRWVVTHDSRDAANGDDWQSTYFGCNWDDNANASFPTRSAELDLLDVDVTLPSRVGVSYGFVVDNNPEVTSRVTNVSDYTLPGFWGDAQPQLFLVQGGKVVASASPQGVSAWNAADATSSMLRTDGFLAPGASVAGKYLLRDIHRCDDSTGSTGVGPGQYTVLAAYSVSVSNAQMDTSGAMPEPRVDLPAQQGALSRAAINDDELLVDVPTPEMHILPAPGSWEAVELQSWTSLGTITVR